MIKLLIFDLDGTLADTLPAIRHAVNLVADKHGYPNKTYEEIRAAIGDGARALIRRSMPEEVVRDESALDRLLSEYDKMYGTTYMETDTMYAGMEDTLYELHRRGYIIAVLSNKQHRYVELIVKNMVREGVVASAIGQRREYPTKPDPTVPLIMAESLLAEPAEVAFIGDSEVDVMTAKNAGMMSVGCDWGYRARDLLESHGADCVISRPEELLEIFV